MVLVKNGNELSKYTNSKNARSLDVCLTKVWISTVFRYSLLKSSITLSTSGKLWESRNSFSKENY